MTAEPLERDVRDVMAATGLSRRAVRALLGGRHRKLFADADGPIPERLIAMAAAYSPAELANQPGVGVSTFIEIEAWLHRSGVELGRRRRKPRSGHGEA